MKSAFVAVLSAAVLAMAPGASAAPAPGWAIHSLATPTNFAQEDPTIDQFYEVTAENSGASPTNGSPIVLTDDLPPGLEAKRAELLIGAGSGNTPFTTTCQIATAGGADRVTCTVTEALAEGEPAKVWPGEVIRMAVHVRTPASVTGGLSNHVSVAGGGAGPAAAVFLNQASATPAEAGFSIFEAGLRDEAGQPLAAAGGHPFTYFTTFAVNSVPAPPGSSAPLVPAGGDLRNISVVLPPGVVGNPLAATRCTAQQFGDVNTVQYGHNNVFGNLCPDSSAVGLVLIQQMEGIGGAATDGGPLLLPVPLYNLVPPRGMPAQFGFQVAGGPVYINTKLRSDTDYGVTAYLHNVSDAKRVTAATVTFWGTPAATSHDRLRGICLNTVGSFSGANCPSSIPAPIPFFREATACIGNPLVTMAFITWAGATGSAGDAMPVPTGCTAPPFAPSIEAKATTSAADSPSGLHFDLHNPQPQDPEVPGEADLKDATVTLPEGFVVNPSSADGLGACSEDQVGYTGMSEGRASFTAEPAQCPDPSKVGTVTVKTPLVDHPLKGAVYLARQNENPFDSLLAIYIAVDDPQTGVVVKLAGKVMPDPTTGRLTTTVEQSPQLPFEDFELDFFEGARAPLRTPATCGTHTTTTTLVPWSAPEGSTVHPQGAFQTTGPAAGQGACPTSAAGVPASWSFSAGAQAPLAGAYSPFTVHLARLDGSRELSSLEVTLPPGVAARFAGVPECSDAQISAAVAREVPGGGKAEQQSPSCPAASRVGTATVGAGAGPSPYYVKGDAYLGGPYKGAPFSIVVITPAVAGPFDLGAVVVRSALYVDPFTAQGTVKSDPIPRILDGIPLDVRSLTVKVDRPGFTLNPTSCEAKSVTGTAVSAGGARTALTNRFQVGECAALAFKPKLKIQLKGSTKRIGHPALKAVLTAKPGEADIGRAQVNLPGGEFLDQGNLNKSCTRPVLLAGGCPASSVYGKAKAWTPLLDRPLEGPVYLVGGFGYKLPALVAELDGQVKVLLVGKVDSGKNKGIRNTFELVPDAPVSRFVLEMKGGKKYGLLENSENLCKASKAKRRAIVRFTGQNGKVEHFKPVVGNECKKHKKKARHHKSYRKGRGGGSRHHGRG
jgi:hypothetical protein